MFIPSLIKSKLRTNTNPRRNASRIQEGHKISVQDYDSYKN